MSPLRLFDWLKPDAAGDAARLATGVPPTATPGKDSAGHKAGGPTATTDTTARPHL
jgi:hypothetical protein